MASQPDAGELRDELKAHLGARKELVEGMEDEVVESFLGKIEESINQRVDERVAEALGPPKRFRVARRVCTGGACPLHSAGGHCRWDSRLVWDTGGCRPCPGHSFQGLMGCGVVDSKDPWTRCRE